MRVFITGGTGLVGSRLIPRLQQRQDTVAVLTRRAAASREKFPDCTIVEGDPMQPGSWMDAVADCEAIVHLAGENVLGKRWNDAQKALLRDSRVKGTANVVEAIKRQPGTPSGGRKVFVSASAIGYYGPHG